MNKRDFIKAGLLGTAGLISLPAMAGKSRLSVGVKQFQLPELRYAYNALEPFFDEESIKIQHVKYHADYTANLNMTLVNSGVRVNNVREVLENISAYNSSMKNSAGAYLNQKMFWKFLSPTGGGEPAGEVGEEIRSQFGSFETFKDKFRAAAKAELGAGWAWLISQNGKLKITSTSNYDSPLMDIIDTSERGFPVLCLNVWEHAYKPRYKNKEADYIDAFWNIVNWDQVNKRYEKSLNLI